LAWRLFRTFVRHRISVSSDAGRRSPARLLPCFYALITSTVITLFSFDLSSPKSVRSLTSWMTAVVGRVRQAALQSSSTQMRRWLSPVLARYVHPPWPSVPMVRLHRPGGSTIISSRSSQSRPEGKEVHLLIRQSRKESGNFTSTEGGSSLVKPRPEKCFKFSNQHTAKQFRMRTNFSPSLGRGGPLECSIRNTSSYPISRQYGLFFL
jgi:hypothetical protein